MHGPSYIEKCLKKTPPEMRTPGHYALSQLHIEEYTQLSLKCESSFYSCPKGAHNSQLTHPLST